MTIIDGPRRRAPPECKMKKMNDGLDEGLSFCFFLVDKAGSRATKSLEHFQTNWTELKEEDEREMRLKK